MCQLEADAQGQQRGCKQLPHHLLGFSFIEVIALWVPLCREAFDFLSRDTVGILRDKRIALCGIFKILHHVPHSLIVFFTAICVCSDAPRCSVEAIQIPTPTATIPRMRLRPIASPISRAAMSEAVIGFTVMVLAMRVGVVRSRAYTHK